MKVSIELSEREVLPGSHINMHVNTRPNSCVCIGGVDKSIMSVSSQDQEMHTMPLR